jgi:putative N6-adenine-specific DNA methylase
VYEYQKTLRHFAQVAGELEADAAAELRELGAREVQPVRRGVSFQAEPAVLYRSAYRSRLVSKILVPLLSFECPSPEVLYRQARGINFADFLGPVETFAVFANVSQSGITHSQYAALKLKDAIVDQFRERDGQRPSVDRRSPDVQFALHVHRDQATISLEASGGALHRRGYRQLSVQAPLQETLAAAMVRHTGWQGERPLVDPFCGSGTLLAEALMHYCGIPSGYLRPRFGLERLPDFDRALWQAEREAGNSLIRPLPSGLLMGSDASPEAIAAARHNLGLLPSGSAVCLRVADFRSLGRLPEHVLLTNPPYGVRLGRPEQVRALYREFGDFLKEHCPGSTAFVYAGDPDLLKAVGLRASGKKWIVNGALRGQLGRFEVFAGSWQARP